MTPSRTDVVGDIYFLRPGEIVRKGERRAEDREKQQGANTSNQAPQTAQSRRSSTSSTCTLFPAPSPDQLSLAPKYDLFFQPGLPNPNPNPLSPRRRKLSEGDADIGSQPLVFSGFGVAEVDDFGNALEGEGGIKRPLPAFLHPYPDDFEMGDLGSHVIKGNEEDPRQVVEFEGRRGSRAKGEIPRAMPLRREVVDGEAAVREAERRTEEYWGVI